MRISNEDIDCVLYDVWVDGRQVPEWIWADDGRGEVECENYTVHGAVAFGIHDVLMTEVEKAALRVLLESRAPKSDLRELTRRHALRLAGVE